MKDGQRPNNSRAGAPSGNRQTDCPAILAQFSSVRTPTGNLTKGAIWTWWWSQRILRRAVSNGKLPRSSVGLVLCLYNLFSNVRRDSRRGGGSPIPPITGARYSMKRTREQVVWDFVHGWLRKAEGDLQAAEYLLAMEQEDYFATAFHAQQAAEKFLKAFLVRHQIPFPKTHDLGFLLELAARADSSLQEELVSATMLTPFGVVFRYPGEIVADREIACRAIQEASRAGAPSGISHPGPASRQGAVLSTEGRRQLLRTWPLAGVA